MKKFKIFLKKIARLVGLFDVFRKLDIWMKAKRGSIHDPEYTELPSWLDGKLLLDVGANLGQSVISLNRLFPQSKIMSFEPNPACHDVLKKVAAKIGQTEVYFVGLGDATDCLTFCVPVLDDGTQLLQEGSFDPSVFSQEVTRERIGAAFNLRKIEIDVHRIDDLDVNPSLIKVDVQGFEMQVLRGAINTIRRARPVLFLERDARIEDELFSFMDPFDYEYRILGCNIIFLPKS
jgi:FkbM family methyltransferase